MDTPENTNRMVLSDMLDQFSSGGGGSSEPFIFTYNFQTGLTNKTYKEIKDAFLSGAKVLYMAEGNGGPGSKTYYYEIYKINVADENTEKQIDYAGGYFYCTGSENEYMIMPD